MGLKEEYKDLFGFFDKDPKEKAENFAQTLQQSLEFSEKMKEKLLKGTEEEKKEVMSLLEELKEQLASQTKDILNQVGLSEEELNAYMENSENFSPEEWNTIQDVRKYVEDLAKKAAPHPLEEKEEVKKAKKIAKQYWMQS